MPEYTSNSLQFHKNKISSGMLPIHRYSIHEYRFISSLWQQNRHKLFKSNSQHKETKRSPKYNHSTQTRTTFPIFAPHIV